MRTSPVSRSTLISAAATSSEGLVITLSLSAVERAGGRAGGQGERRRELARRRLRLRLD